MSEEQKQPLDQNQSADSNQADAGQANSVVENTVSDDTQVQPSASTQLETPYTHDGNAYGEPGIIPPAPIPPAPMPPAAQISASSQQPEQPQQTQQQVSSTQSQDTQSQLGQSQPTPQYYDHNGYPAPAPEQQTPADQASGQLQQPGQPYPPQQGQPYQGDPNDLNDPNNPNSPFNPNNPNSPYAQQPGCFSFGAGQQAGVGYDPNLKLTPLNKVVWTAIGFICGFFGVLIAWLFGMTMPAQVRYQVVKFACIGFFIQFALLLFFGYFGGGEMVGTFISGDGGAGTGAPSGGESGGSGSGSGGSGSSAWG